ncbi:MAG: hypothetical protein GY871_08415 [Actinomycetales bacterium]|nr:hypothetical protein [Actinomycetales bacterium]
MSLTKLSGNDLVNGASENPSYVGELKRRHAKSVEKRGIVHPQTVRLAGWVASVTDATPEPTEDPAPVVIDDPVVQDTPDIPAGAVFIGGRMYLPAGSNVSPVPPAPVAPAAPRERKASREVRDMYRLRCEGMTAAEVAIVFDRANAGVVNNAIGRFCKRTGSPLPSSI